MTPTLVLLFLTIALDSYGHTVKDRINVYGNSSFVSGWGPGPKITALFEKTCNCVVKLSDPGHSSFGLEKLAVRGGKGADVVLGLDQLQIKLAQQKIEWLNLESLQVNEYVAHGVYKNFVPIDWAPLTFVFRKSQLARPPTQLADLLSTALKGQILLEDPRLSTTGLQFLAWVKLSKKEESQKFLMQLKDQVHSVSPSWGTAYGMFKKGQGQLVYSYLTSPVYHWREEKNFDFQSLELEGKLGVQYELAGIPKSCSNCELAKKFIKFLLTEEAQKIIMDLNFMLPVNQSLISKTDFEKLPRVATYSPTDYQNLETKSLIEIWKSVFR